MGKGLEAGKREVAISRELNSEAGGWKGSCLTVRRAQEQWDLLRGTHRDVDKEHQGLSQPLSSHSRAGAQPTEATFERTAWPWTGWVLDPHSHGFSF